ncbi:FkbM family methyltransferase [Jannaschia sp. CCS1]|nr:FkbM family methyltransferase [Jannaschia sp. CCS1]
MEDNAPRQPIVASTQNVETVEEEVQKDSPLLHYYSDFPAISVMREFEAHGATASPGVVTNFLGVRIPSDIMPSILKSLEGQKEGFPIPGNWHADIAEWAAALLSVREAKTSYRILEVGCGWGCWLSNMGVAAKARGLKIDLIGVEGDQQNIEHAKHTLALNGIEAHEFQLTNGVASARNGVALFPILDGPGEVWGAEPIFHPDAETISKARAAGSHTELKCYTLDDLSHGKPIDLLHVDIQGSELDFVKGNFDEISTLVKRILIGTHSRYLEGSLQKFLLDQGWALEMDRPAICTNVAGKPQIAVDGVLLFRSPTMPHPVF